jgi:hypothetical protein
MGPVNKTHNQCKVFSERDWAFSFGQSGEGIYRSFLFVRTESLSMEPGWGLFLLSGVSCWNRSPSKHQCVDYITLQLLGFFY